MEIPVTPPKPRLHTHDPSHDPSHAITLARHILALRLPAHSLGPSWPCAFLRTHSAHPGPAPSCALTQHCTHTHAHAKCLWTPPRVTTLGTSSGHPHLGIPTRGLHTWDPIWAPHLGIPTRGLHTWVAPHTSLSVHTLGPWASKTYIQCLHSPQTKPHCPLLTGFGLGPTPYSSPMLRWSSAPLYLSVGCTKTTHEVNPWQNSW